MRRLRAQLATKLGLGLWGRDREEPLVRELRGSVEAELNSPGGQKTIERASHLRR